MSFLEKLCVFAPQRRTLFVVHPRAEQLIDDFKGAGTNGALSVAISVDMLDTGIDIPEIVNLVFAKPIKSKVKFWQMIGRGTRLCPDLFGQGQNKKMFRIFDHWRNFEYFDLHYIPAEPAPGKSLMQQVFEARIHLAATALAQSDSDAFRGAIKVLREDIASLPEESIPVREKWKEVRVAIAPGKLEGFEPELVALLKGDIASLMQWVNIRGHAEAYGLTPEKGLIVIIATGVEQQVPPDAAHVAQQRRELKQKMFGD
jgi:type I restriction enzyme R subunit